MAFKFPLSDLQLWRSTAVPDLGNKEGEQRRSESLDWAALC